MKWASYVSIAIIAIGAAFTLFVVAQIPGEVFFSGDGALKALHAKQHLEQGFSVGLKLNAEPWVRELWKQGLYPFKPPFVYEEGGRYIVGFPFLFSLLTAPFYGIAGYHGFYVLPLASLWLTWMLFFSHCRRIGLKRVPTLIGLALLVLASPLTLYGAIYWEHVPAALLALFGLEPIARLYAGSERTLPALLSGLLAGCSVWLRPEYLCLMPILLVLSLSAARSRQGGTGLAVRFIGGCTVSTAAFFVANLALYGRPLGAHSRQVLEAFSLQGRLASSLGYLGEMGRGLVVDDPASLVSVAAIVFVFLQPRREPLVKYGRALAVTAIAFFLLVPFVVPNAGGKQLGPRYILFLAPVIALLIAVALQSSTMTGNRRFKVLAHFAIAAVLLAGAYRNLYTRTAMLIDDYRHRVWPALELIAEDPARFVVVTNQWTAQELEATFDDKTYFHAPTIEDGVRVAEALSEHDIRRFLVVLRYDESAPLRVDVPPPAPIERLELSPLGLHGSYYILEATSIPRSR